MTRWKAPPDGLLAAFLLAFLATAGLFYVNIMPAIVTGLSDGLGFTARQAGLVASANVYGAAAGALASVFLVRRMNWRRAQVMLLPTLIALDLASMLVRHPEAMIALRLVHGLVGGMSVGLALAVIGRTAVPDRGFGMLLFVQYGLGGLGNMLLPPLVPKFGVSVLFLSLAAFSAVTLLFMTWLADYPPRPAAPVQAGGRARFAPLAAALVALFLFQAANMGLAAFIIGLGRAYGLSQAIIGPSMGVSSWIAMLGAALVIVLAGRAGRLWPILAAMGLTLAGTWAFHLSGSGLVYFLANCGTAITWAFVVPYLLGLCAAFDPTGRTASLAGFFSKMGLASGPAVAAILLHETRYGLLIDISLLGLVASTLAAVWPAWLSDRAGRPTADPA